MMDPEKRVPVVVAFGLGFLFASFIFAFFDPRDGGSRDHKVHYGDPAQRIKAYDRGAMPAASPETAPAEVSVVENAEGLYALVAGEKILLSKKVAAGEGEMEGMYVSIVSKSVSPNGKYVYYCEQQSVSDVSCVNYVYDVENAGLHRVEHDDTTLAVDSESLVAGWDSDGKLKVNQLISAQAITPWQLIHSE